MKLTLQLQLLPDAQQSAVLLETMERSNEAASFAAKVGFEAGVSSQPSIHRRCYAEIRQRFGLSAQMAVRAIGKAVEAFATLKAKGREECPGFRTRGAITYDERILSFKGLDRVSLWTLAGRMILPLAYGEYQGQRFDRIKGQVDLVYRDGRFYLYATVDLPEDALIEPVDFLGVDLGIVNLATDSDGNTYSGGAVEETRRRRHRSRRSYQKTGTRSASAGSSGWPGARPTIAGTRTTASPTASSGRPKAPSAASPWRTSPASASGQRFGPRNGRGTRDGPSRSSRASSCTRRSWPGCRSSWWTLRDTSRTCSACGHCEKGNRKSRGEFACKHCGYSEDADRNAARNVRDRAVVKRPDLAASADPGPRSRAS